MEQLATSKNKYVRGRSRLFSCCVPLTLLIISTGCGSGGEFSVAPTSGTIETVGGEIIANGRLRLTPIPDSTAKAGKAAIGEIKDGQFVLTTYGNGDGAVIGKHKVRLLEAYQPHGDDADSESSAKHNCEIAPESKTVEISAGENVLNLKAVPEKKKRR